MHLLPFGQLLIMSNVFSILFLVLMDRTILYLLNVSF